MGLPGSMGGLRKLAGKLSLRREIRGTSIVCRGIASVQKGLVRSGWPGLQGGLRGIEGG